MCVACCVWWCCVRSMAAWAHEGMRARLHAQWLVEGYEGKMPCLLHNGEAYTESSDIVEYLNFFFPDVSLS